MFGNSIIQYVLLKIKSARTRKKKIYVKLLYVDIINAKKNYLLTLYLKQKILEW